MVPDLHRITNSQNRQSDYEGSVAKRETEDGYKIDVILYVCDFFLFSLLLKFDRIMSQYWPRRMQKIEE